MGRQNAPLFCFNRGEVSKDALARVDVEKLRLASECQLNWLPTVVGQMSLRPGLQYINEVLGDRASIMVPFVYSKFDTALIELSPNVMRVEISDQLVTRVAVATVVSDPTFQGVGNWTTAGTTAGATASVAGGLLSLTAGAVGSLAQAQQVINVAAGDYGKEHALRINVLNGPVTVRAGSAAGQSDLIDQTILDDGTHSLAFTPTTNVTLQIETTDAWVKKLTSVSIEPAGVMTLPTPWGADVLPSIQYDQSGDIIFCTAYGGQQYKIERRALHSWSVVKYKSANGPFSTVASGNASLTAGATTGNTTITANEPVFEPSCEGQQIQMFTGGQFNSTLLGAGNAFTPAVRVTGVGATARNYTWTITGTFTGTLTLQRSFDGKDSGFTDVTTVTGPATTSVNTGGTGGSPPLDNVISWERYGFKGSDYVSGTATAVSSYSGGGSWGRARILEYISPTQVFVEILDPFSSTLPSNIYSLGDWSNAKGWPTSVAFYEGRLGFAGGLNLWESQSDNFTGFAQQDDAGQPLGDSGAIIETFGSGAVDSVPWLLALSRLLAGREQTIESIRSSSFDEVLTPTNISTKSCATHGAARMRPIKIDKDGIFVSEGGRVFALQFDAQAIDYVPIDLTRLNTEIYGAGFVDTAVQRHPDTMAWLPRGDGQLAGLLYDRQDEVVAWWRLQTLGIIENVCVLPAPTGTESFVYLHVRRTINGITRRFREKLAPRDNCIGNDLNQLFDSHVVYQGAPVTTVTLAHLPNTLVGIWGDGAYIGEATTDANGVATMPDGNSYSTIVAGLLGEVVQRSSNTATTVFGGFSKYEGLPCEVFGDGKRLGVYTIAGGNLSLDSRLKIYSLTACFGFVAPYMSAKLAYAAQRGSAINQPKKIDHVGLLLFDTHRDGFSLGQEMDLLDPLPEMEDDDAVDDNNVYVEYDAIPMEVPGDWKTDARLCMMAQAPYPATVSGVVISMTTNEKL